MEAEAKGGKLCSKCHKELAKVQILAVTYCTKCFMENALHKFKTTLRTKLRVWKDDACLVCIDGGIGSMCLLDLLGKCINESVRKKVFLNLTALHIDESSVYISNKDQIIKACEEQKLSYLIIPLEYVFEIDEFPLPSQIADTQITVVKRVSKSERKSKVPEESKKVPTFVGPESKIFTTSEESKAKLTNLLEAFPIQYKHEIVTYLKKWLILYFATKYYFTKVLLAHNANSISAHLFELMVSGRGQNIASDSDYADGKYGNNIMFIRTLRDFIDKEIFYYSAINGIKGATKVHYKDYASLHLPGKGSTEIIIKSFLTQLQSNFMSSIPTITQTALKVSVVKPNTPNPFCALCMGIRDPDNCQTELLMNTMKKLPEMYRTSLCYGCYAIIASKVKDVDKMEKGLPKVILRNLKKEESNIKVEEQKT